MHYVQSHIPKTKIVREGKRKYKLGRVAWNRGLTAETSEIVKLIASKNSISMKLSHASGNRVVSPMRPEHRHALSQRQSLRNSGGRCKWYVVNGIHVQGTWEKNVAIKLTELGLLWTKPHKKEDMWPYERNGKQHNYSPDFFIPSLQLWLEIKGFWWGDDEDKMKIVSRTYPDRRLVVLQKLEYERFMRGELVW